MDLKETGLKDVDWIHLVPLKVQNFLGRSVTIFSRRTLLHRVHWFELHIFDTNQYQITK